MFMFILPSLLTGCKLSEEIDKFQEDIGKLTNDFVVSAFYVGSEEFEYAGINMSEVEGLQDVQSVVYLATADVTGESEPVPLSRATVSAESASLGTIAYTEPDPGYYYTNSDGGLMYTPEEQVTISAEQDGVVHSISVMTPAAAEFDLPDAHPSNTDLVVDISGQGFDSALIGVVLFPPGGEPDMVYSNEPTTFQELYDLSHPEEEGNAGIITIPGEVFSQENALYMVSIGGVIAADTVDMVEVNTAFSSLLAAQMAFDVICVPECITLPE